MLYYKKNNNKIIQSDNVQWSVPRQDNIFVGRYDLLDKIQIKLTRNFDNLIMSVVTGLGGVGKTQLVLRYLYSTKTPYTIKIWFASENIEDLHRQYIDFAKFIGYSKIDSNQKDVVNYVKKWLENNPGWLIVYDNPNYV